VEKLESKVPRKAKPNTKARLREIESFADYTDEELEVIADSLERLSFILLSASKNINPEPHETPGLTHTIRERKG
jgi:hypothetical protein